MMLTTSSSAAAAAVLKRISSSARLPPAPLKNYKAVNYFVSFHLGASGHPPCGVRFLSSSSATSGADEGRPSSDPSRNPPRNRLPLHPAVERARYRSTSDHLASDQTTLWHPYTSLSSRSPPAPVLPVQSARGCRVFLEDPLCCELIDGMSSWWAAVHGYNHPELNSALEYQVQDMAHVMFGGLTHRPAAELAELLVSVSPAGLTKVFLADSGSVSVEVALKMALQYQRGIGMPGRTKFVSVRGGYHGDTLGCMGVCDPDTGMHSAFGDVVRKNIFVCRPPCDQSKRLGVGDSNAGASGCNGCMCGGDGADLVPALEASCRELEDTLAERSMEVAALILEPLLQGAGGMRFYPSEYLRRARRVCDEHGILLICDEIATGFGRAGTGREETGGRDSGGADADRVGGNLFASQVAGIRPDIMTVGKALTGGYMTMGATLTTNEVADGVSAVPPNDDQSDGGGDSSGEALPLMHGPTFMGNPLACSVAVASVSMLLRPSASRSSTRPMWLCNVSRIESRLRANLRPAASLSSVADVRVSGAIGVIEMKRPLDAAAVTRRCIELGVWLRPFGRLLYCMPPYIISGEELDVVTEAMVRLAEEAPGAREK